MLYFDVTCVLQMDAVSIGAVSRGCNSNIDNLNDAGAIKLQMTLRAVYYCDATDCDIVATVDSNSLGCDYKEN